jgi:hypothetical protein
MHECIQALKHTDSLSRAADTHVQDAPHLGLERLELLVDANEICLFGHGDQLGAYVYSMMEKGIDIETIHDPGKN